MNRGPVPGQTQGQGGAADLRGRAVNAWDGEPPDWVLILADACQASSQSAVAKRVGYSAATVSQALSNSYRGDIERVAEMVRGALMASSVDCPVLGTIGRDRCLTEQKEPFRATSAHRAQLYHACRGGCPNARNKENNNG